MLQAERPPVEGLPVDEVYAAAASGPGGLTNEEATARAAVYGPNVLRAARPKPLLLRFGAHFTHLMALLLWVGGLIALRRRSRRSWASPIWLVNVINGVFSFWQEYKAERATEACASSCRRTPGCCATAARHASPPTSWSPAT